MAVGMAIGSSLSLARQEYSLSDRDEILADPSYVGREIRTLKKLAPHTLIKTLGLVGQSANDDFILRSW